MEKITSNIEWIKKAGFKFSGIQIDTVLEFDADSPLAKKIERDIKKGKIKVLNPDENSVNHEKM